MWSSGGRKLSPLVGHVWGAGLVDEFQVYHRAAGCGDGQTLADIGPHGSREMPVWGTQYRQRVMQSPDGKAQPEWYVRGRIVALLDYLERIQVR